MEMAANLNDEQRHSRVWFLRSGRSSLAERGRRTGSGRQRRHTVGEGPGAGGGGGGAFSPSERWELLTSRVMRSAHDTQDAASHITAPKGDFRVCVFFF